MSIWKQSISVEKIKTVANSREKRPIRTMEYFSNAWNLVQQDFALHVGYALIVYVIMNFVSFLAYALYPGWFIAAYLKRKNQPIDFSSFFKCFEHLGGLLLQTLLYCLLFTIPFVFLGIFMFIIADIVDSPIVLMPLFFFVLLLYAISMFFIFAPAFIVFADMNPWEAMKASFKVIKNNLGGFIGFFGMIFVMTILGFMTCGLLFIVITPVVQVAIYFAYEDLFQPDISDEMDDVFRYLV